jgi:hypothetical protein
MPEQSRDEEAPGREFRGKRLDSWKEIAGYLNRHVTTVRRWERHEGLPVHRQRHDQTDVVYFWSENTDAQWNRHLIALAGDLGLGPLATARMFAMVHAASADAIIVGFTAKYHYRFWRPRTAIPALDDPSWKPLLSVNHPEYPSAHAFWSTALTSTLTHLLGTHRVTWTIDSRAPQLDPDARERTYHDLKALAREIDDARVWAGLHWRHSMRHGAKIGHEVARHVSRNFFKPLAS